MNQDYVIIIIIIKCFSKMSQKLLADHKIKLNYWLIMNKLLLIK